MEKSTRLKKKAKKCETERKLKVALAEINLKAMDLCWVSNQLIYKFMS